MIYIVRVSGGMIFGFLCARFVRRFEPVLGMFTDVVGITVALGTTSLWIYLCNLVSPS